MNSVDHSFFKKKFFEFTNRTFDVVSTVDHPYSSPPIRLLDCHYKLKKLNNCGLKPLICIWDVNLPNINRYRCELSLDVGIFGTKDEDFLIFSDKFIYPLQKPKLIDFPEFKKRVQLILERLQNLTNESMINRNRKFIENLDKIIFLYQGVIKDVENGTDFYRYILKNFYTLIGFTDLANFVEKSFQPYFGSAIIKKWIPYCIEETKNESYGFLNLLDAELFKKPYFRNSAISNKVDDKLSDPEYVKNNIDGILEKIGVGDLIPSYGIFFWTLFLADIKHFGNDYDFYNNLNDILIKKNLNLRDQESLMQLTKRNQDGQNIIQFEKDRSFNCFLENGEYAIKKNNPLKESRISSLPAMYCHLGEELGKVAKDILENKIDLPKIIKMGE